MLPEPPGYGPDLKARYLAWRETQPREMPDDFGLAEMADDGNLITCQVRVREPAEAACYIGLGFAWTDETKINPELYKKELRQAVWQAIELIRLGHTDELKSMGYIT